LERQDFAHGYGVDPDERTAGKARREPESEPLPQMEPFFAPEPEFNKINRSDQGQDEKK
jgi:hypothetical protein